MNWNYKGYVFIVNQKSGIWKTIVEGQPLTAESLEDLKAQIDQVIANFPKIHLGLDIHRFSKDQRGITAGTWVAAFRDSTSWLDHLLKADSLIQLLAMIEMYRVERPQSTNPWQLPRAERIAALKLTPEIEAAVLAA